MNQTQLLVIVGFVVWTYLYHIAPAIYSIVEMCTKIRERRKAKQSAVIPAEAEKIETVV
jgi:hypothetical protein